MSERTVLFEGRFLRLVRRDGWEWCERVRASGVVGVIAVTPARALILVEQHRPPVDARVIELPAGLAGDLADAPEEELVVAARRELMEETGWEADDWALVTDGPASAGLTNERVHLFHATGLRKTGPGGGDGSEDIVVHEIPIDGLLAWLAERRRAGVLHDPKVIAALAVLASGR
jgi:ADP-ribose pyrophosphatase